MLESIHDSTKKRFFDQNVTRQARLHWLLSGMQSHNMTVKNTAAQRFPLESEDLIEEWRSGLFA